MKRIYAFFFVLFLFLQVYTQNNQNWTTDLDTLEHHLLQKEYLFTHFHKRKFKEDIQKLKNTSFKTQEQQYWSLNTLLAKFKNPVISIENLEFKRFSFKIKEFKSDFYITNIHQNFSFVLGYKLQKVNDFPLKRILKNSNNINSINIKSYLEFYQFSTSDTLRLELLSYKNKRIIIKLPFDKNYNLDEMEKIIPKKTPFYLEKQDRWFWQYGINFGQQVYFKYNVGLSKEFIEQAMDSLQISEITLARMYNLPLQSIYDAPSFDDFTEKFFLKFKKRRYRKLFIDFRNNTSGNVLALKKFILKLKKLKRINKKNRLFLFVDKTISSSVMETIIKLQKETKAQIIGEKTTGIPCSTDKIYSFYLPNSEFKIYYPSQKMAVVTIQPDIPIYYTFKHYKKGVDPILQKVLK